MSIETIILLVLGIALLFMGRRLFWLFAGIVGFAFGWYLIAGLLHLTGLVGLLIALVAGLICAGLVRWLGKWAIRIIAALAGAALVPAALANLGMMGGISQVAWAAIGAAIGFFFAWFAEKWALIALSAVLGAQMIMDAVKALIPSLSPTVFLLAIVVLAVIGILFQSRQG